MSEVKEAQPVQEAPEVTCERIFDKNSALPYAMMTITRRRIPSTIKSMKKYFSVLKQHPQSVSIPYEEACFIYLFPSPNKGHQIILMFESAKDVSKDLSTIKEEEGETHSRMQSTALPLDHDVRPPIKSKSCCFKA